MFKKILIFNSSQENNQTLFGIFNELKNRDFYFKQVKPNFAAYFNNKFRQIFFIIFLPVLFFIFIFYLTYCKINKTRAIVCLNIGEKIIITPIAKLLKIKVIWIEDVDSIVLKNNIIKPIFWLYKFFSKKTALITFSGFVKNKLEQKGFLGENIRLIQPGIKLNNRERQENLFNELAQAGNHNYKRKFFTVGTAVSLNKNQKIEDLFAAVKICQTVIPGIQLIIAGEGEERKNLSWVAKKMELSNITWFVGEQPHLKKWLDNFDVFVIACETPALEDIIIIIKAMAAGLPVVGPRDYGLEKIIAEECLFDEGSGETLAKQIIDIWHDKRKRLKLGKENQERVEKYFMFDRMVGEIEKML